MSAGYPVPIRTAAATHAPIAQTGMRHPRKRMFAIRATATMSATAMRMYNAGSSA